MLLSLLLFINCHELYSKCPISLNFPCCTGVGQHISSSTCFVVCLFSLVSIYMATLSSQMMTRWQCIELSKKQH